MTEKFQTVTSKVDKPITYLLMGLMWVVVLIIVVIIGVIFENMYSHFKDYLQNSLSTFFILIFAQFLLAFCLIALIMGLMDRKKEHIRTAIIDKKGVTFYSNSGNIINTVSYHDLQRAKNGSYDTYIYSTGGKYPKTYLNIYLKNPSGETAMTRIDFNFEYVILSNQFEMYRQFLRGIQCFRPDLRINPQTIEQYSLTPDFPPVKDPRLLEFLIAFLITFAILALIYSISLLIWR
ncbi:hypothetical protein EG344_04090 [Chryseobacterium sp. G0162]|uniref:hypothetical protein n=1 Tax=unclassified Chryseobacterium TaxID=2593645 RepID=UPI000F4E3B2D|nr:MULTISPECIES: hypothetical protein [unclassified Chryseobacterium]AZB08091.1 hypothetical protein EG344_04090 [Chryseobacterium sp. G0162]